MTLLRVTAPLASLLFFSSFASAQVYAANCTLATWNWVLWFRQYILWSLSDLMHVFRHSTLFLKVRAL